jgi:hypothetical protein
MALIVTSYSILTLLSIFPHYYPTISSAEFKLFPLSLSKKKITEAAMRPLAISRFSRLQTPSREVDRKMEIRFAVY